MVSGDSNSGESNASETDEPFVAKWSWNACETPVHWEGSIRVVTLL